MSAREELLSLAQELRAHLEWQVETGVTGLPADPVHAPRSVGVPARARASASATGSLTERVGDAAAGAAVVEAAVAASTGSLGSAGSAAVPSAARDVRESLRVLSNEVSGCTRCELHATRKNTVFARGNPEAELCFIGEGPGADEDEQGLPFVGKAGQLLDRMIAAMGYARDDVYVCNIVKCRPPENRKPEPAEMAACTPFLRKQLELVAPRVIVALGATAVEGLLGTTGGGITRLRGQWKLYRAIPMMPTFHPAYLLRNPLAKREVWADLQAVLKQLGRSSPPAGRAG